MKQKAKNLISRAPFEKLALNPKDKDFEESAFTADVNLI